MKIQIEQCNIHSRTEVNSMTLKTSFASVSPSGSDTEMAMAAYSKFRAPSEMTSTKQTGGDYAFKCYVIVSMTFIWTSYTLMIRYTRSVTPEAEFYFSTTVVFLSECTKCVLAVILLFKEHSFSFEATKKVFVKEFLNKPKELLKMSVPSLVYSIQNNLDFVALANLDAGVYQVTTQLKVVSTAIFMVLMLGKRYSRTRWIGIMGLFAGVALVQYDAVLIKRAQQALKLSSNSMQATAVKPVTHEENYLVGLTAVLITCATAGFAGVYFEKMLKDGSSTPFWIRNIQLYSCGIVSSAFSCLSTEGAQINMKGFFFGYNQRVIAIIGLLSIGGLYISLVMKHLDNLHKSFASAVSIIFVFLASVYLFESMLGWYFVLGAVIVCSSIVLYNSVPE